MRLQRVLRSEKPNLHTMAASNYRDHALRSLHYRMFGPNICIVFLPVRGESHNQRNATGEVATVA